MKTDVGKTKRLFNPTITIEDTITVKNIVANMDRSFLPQGSRIGKYQIIEEIDRGGMAVVYKVCQLDLDRIVALKVLPANVTIHRNFIERFLSEAHSVAKLHHPNIVNIHEVSMEKNIYYLAMDYIPGKNLFYYLNQEKPKLVDVLEIIRQLTDALSYAHGRKILHRDLKLNNVIMDTNKNPVLIDFGLAKTLESTTDNFTEPGEIAGSPAYMAPERVYGKGLDPRSDICSLGIMLYEMLTFKNPYLDPRSIVQTTKNVIEANPIPPRNLVPWLPIEVESIVLKAMRADPNERYQSMEEFKEDIKRYQQGDIVLARPPSLFAKLRRFLTLNWIPLTFSSVSFGFLLMIGLLLYVQNGKERSYWKLAYFETFDSTEMFSKWHVPILGEDIEKNTWFVQDSVLGIKNAHHAYIRLERSLTRDIRVEFDMKISPFDSTTDYCTSGFFMCGNEPEEGYRFYIHTQPTAVSGISFPFSNFLFYDYDQITFTPDTVYSVLIEKHNKVISFWINSVLIARIYDFNPQLGKDYQKIGFFAHGGSVNFDNLKIFHKAIPRLAKPTIIADRFREQGDFETAVEEYRDILKDFSRSDISRYIQINIVGCLIQLHRFEEAENVFTEIKKEKLTESEKAHLYFYKAMMYKKQGRIEEMDRTLFYLSVFFPNETVTKSTAFASIKACYNLLILNKIETVISSIITLTNRYPEFQKHFGRIHVQVLESCIMKGAWRRAIDLGQQIIDLHKKNEEIAGKARILLAKMYVSRFEKSKAIDVLTPCLTGMNETAVKWEAWMTLGEIYEYGKNYTDALMVYDKIRSECPKTIESGWMASIRLSEIKSLMGERGGEKRIINEVIRDNHMFVKQRLIARYYANHITKNEFAQRMTQLEPMRDLYLYYGARKAINENNIPKAINMLQEFSNRGHGTPWDRLRITQLVKILKIRDNIRK